jgi:hypothetical protein
VSFATRFRLFGATADIEKAMSACEYAIQLTPDDSPHTAFLQRELGNMHALRFERFGVSGDIDKAIEVLENAL